MRGPLNPGVLLLFFILLFLLVLGKKVGFKTGILVVIAFVVLEVVFLLVVNDLVLYESPEKAFAAAHNGRIRAQCVLTGEETALVLGHDENETVYSIVDRTEKGWKIGSTGKIVTSKQLLPDGSTVMVFHKRDTADYYVELLFSDGKDHTVTDGRETAWSSSSDGERIRSYCAVIPAGEGDYVLTVDGESIQVSIPWDTLPETAC